MIRLLLSAILLAAVSPCALSEPLGERAQTYQVDKDGREVFKDVMRAKQRSGEIDQFWKRYREQTIEAVKHPASLGVPTRYATRSELRSLRFVMASNIYNERGAVVVKQGTVIEPLKVQPLTSGLVFIDGTDPSQVEYAIARGRKERLKIVLTAGSPFDLRVKYQNTPWQGALTIPFYFDQRKMIINTMNRLYGVDIASVPATLTQRGDQLLVEFGMETRP